MSEFKVGKTVKWTSQSGGVHYEKKGVIAAIVPAYKGLDGVTDAFISKFKLNFFYGLIGKATYENNAFSKTPRDHDRFLILVPGLTKGKRWTLSCPLVNYLKGDLGAFANRSDVQRVIKQVMFYEEAEKPISFFSNQIDEIQPNF